MRINIGCGRTPTQGWRNFDNSLAVRLSQIPLLGHFLTTSTVLTPEQAEFLRFAKSHSIEFGDAVHGLPIPASSAEVVYASHVFEHLDRREARLFLREVKRVLTGGGILRLSVPDLHKTISTYIATQDADQMVASTLLALEKPHGLVPRLKNLIVGPRHHHWMYDGPSLVRLLCDEGFSDAQVMPAGATLIESPEPLNLFEREDESVYVEATAR